MANRVITLDAHFAQFQCLFNRCNVINVFAINLLCEHLLNVVKINSDTHILPIVNPGESLNRPSENLRAKHDFHNRCPLQQ